jgi:hypothetical protein
VTDINFHPDSGHRPATARPRCMDDKYCQFQIVGAASVAGKPERD